MYLNQYILQLYQTYKKCFEESSGWIIDPFIYFNINIAKSNPLDDSIYNKLPKKLDYFRKRLINFQKIDDSECNKWCLFI